MIPAAPPTPRRLHCVFRWDAGRQIGNGHFMRCTVLCTELLARGHVVSVLTQQVPAPLHKLLQEQGITVQPIAPHSDGLAELATVARAQPVDWLVIDHYGIDACWESAARPFAARTMVIDDLADRPHDCDLLLDQNVPNPLQQRYADLVSPHCAQAIGWSYLLARPGFYAPGAQARSGTLVFLGGGDHSATLSDLLGRLLRSTERHPLRVLVSSAYLPLAHWQALVTDRGRVHCDLPDPAPLYSSAALAVVRCGFVSYELALLGVPAVHIHTSTVQAEVAHALERLGAGVALPEAQLDDTAALNNAFERAAALVPAPLNERLSPGASRVADLLEHIYAQR